MATTISVRLGKDILKELSGVEKKWQSDRSEAVRRLLVSALQQERINAAMDNLANHKISVGKAAEVCGMNLWEMLDLLKQRNIDWTGYSEEDLERDLKLLK
ncbi:UPF0175 family protein [Candidatus Woesearchaeota archaeon]|nr:UPF0175 family protein [Candidatus Woesearchaeota archaeon]